MLIVLRVYKTKEIRMTAIVISGALLNPLSVSIAATSPEDVPVPVNKRIGAADPLVELADRGPQAVRMPEISKRDAAINSRHSVMRATVSWL